MLIYIFPCCFKVVERITNLSFRSK